MNTSETSQLHIWPKLEENDVAAQNHGHHMQFNPGNVNHVISGLPVVDGRASEDAINEQLLKSDQLDIDAARRLLGKKIPGNSITSVHYYRILKKLAICFSPAKRVKDLYSKDFPAKEYQRILLRLARTCNTPSSKIYKARGCIHPLDYPKVLEAFQESTVEFTHPLSYVEIIGNLLGSLRAGFQMMRQQGDTEEVYFIAKDKEEFVNGVLSLAALLNGEPSA